MKKLVVTIQDTPATSSVESWDQTVNEIGHNIRERDHLVVIPTETVYGLAANALSSKAVAKIFKLKKRPTNNPLICHVNGYEDALKLCKLTNIENCAFKLLTNNFWPGPLTIVTKSSERVSTAVTASTQYVAIRSPRNQIAQDVIRAAQVPLAAPSANISGYISSSEAAHVKKNFNNCEAVDLNQTELIVLNGGKCSIGIESTICKLEESNNILYVSILRDGYITPTDIRNILKPLDNKVTLIDALNVQNELIISPGLSMKHYSPKITTVLTTCPIDDAQIFSKLVVHTTFNTVSAKKCVCLDLIGFFKPYEKQFCHYIPLFLSNEKTLDSCNFHFIQNNLFTSLYNAEEIAIERKAILILVACFNRHDKKLPEAAYSICDRLYRAAAGEIATVCIEKA